jgi:hypothetical protein
MLNAFTSKKQTSNASARVVDGKLILSLPDAQTPVVWQMDITQTKSSALEARHDEEKGIYILTLKTPRGATVEIAPFDNRDFAVEGLMAASHALENAHGQIRRDNAATAANDQTVYTAPPSHTKSSTKKIFLVIVAIFALLFLFNIWGSQLPRTPSSVTSNISATADINPRESSGVAVSADDFLRAQ